MHLPHLKPVPIGCCYRPPGTDVQYLKNVCVLIDRVADVNGDISLLGGYEHRLVCETMSNEKTDLINRCL